MSTPHPEIHKTKQQTSIKKKKLERKDRKKSAHIISVLPSIDCKKTFYKLKL